MVEFLAASQNFPFTVALCVMFGIALLEGITTFFGSALSGVLDAILPDSLVGISGDLSGPEIQSQTPLSRLLGWIRVGQVPVLMLLVVFLTSFGLIGLSFQLVMLDAFGRMMPGYLVSVPSVMLSIPVVRGFGGVLNRYMPKDETDAVSEASLVGRVATITIGTARCGSPAEARVRDSHGTTHYVMVEPDVDGEAFGAGESMLLVKREGHLFKAIRNVNSVLVDQDLK